MVIGRRLRLHIPFARESMRDELVRKTSSIF